MKQTIISKCFSKMKRIMLTLFAALCVGSVWGEVGINTGSFTKPEDTAANTTTKYRQKYGRIYANISNQEVLEDGSVKFDYYIICYPHSSQTADGDTYSGTKLAQSQTFTLKVTCSVEGRDISITEDVCTITQTYKNTNAGKKNLVKILETYTTQPIEGIQSGDFVNVSVNVKGSISGGIDIDLAETIKFVSFGDIATTWEMGSGLDKNFIVQGSDFAAWKSVKLHYVKNSGILGDGADIIEAVIENGAFNIKVPYEDLDDYLTWKIELIDEEGTSVFYEDTQGRSEFELKREELDVIYTWSGPSAGNWNDANNWTADNLANYGYPGKKGRSGYCHSLAVFNGDAEVDLQGAEYCMRDGRQSLTFGSNANVVFKNGTIGLHNGGLVFGGTDYTVEYRNVKLVYKVGDEGDFNLSFSARSTNIFTGSIDHPWHYLPVSANTKIVFKDGVISTEYSNSGFENLSSQEVEINNAKWTINVNNSEDGAKNGIAGLVKFRDGADRQAQLYVKNSQKMKLYGTYDFVLPENPYAEPYAEAGFANAVDEKFNVRVDVSNISGECKVPLIKFSAADDATKTAMQAVADNAAKLQVVVDGEAIEKAARNAKLVWENGILYYSQTVQGAATVGDVVYASFAEAFAAAQAGDTVKLYQDVKLSEILVINKAITLDGNGCTLTSTAARAINVSGVDGVTIKNLTISASGERAINVIQGATNVTIENVTATAYNYTVNIASSAANAVVAINNSTLNGLCTVNVAAAGAKVTIDGSTVNCNDNNTNVGESYAALCLGKEAVGASIVATNTVVNVTEGSDSVKARNGAENGTITIDDSTDNVTEVVAVISYAGQNSYHSFYTLEDAIGFAKDADTITILKDIATDVAFTVAKKVTIDLNGKTIATTENDKVGDGVFCVVAGGELTINDSVGTGTVNGVGGNAYNIAIWANGGSVVINGGTYTNVGAKDDGPDGAHFDLIYVKNGGSVVINGGTFKAETPAWTLNSHDTVKGTIVVNGGFFYQFNPGDCATEGAGTNWCADGLRGVESAEKPGYYTVEEYSWVAPMPEKDGDAGFTAEYTAEVLAALEANAATSVAVKVNGDALKGDAAVNALNTAVKCFEGALVFDGTAADLDIVIEVVEVNVENPAASKVVVKRGETVLAVKTGVTPTVKYVDLGSDAVTFKIVFE